MAESLHPAVVDHLPPFVTAPGETDILFNVVIVFLLLVIFMIGNLYLRLHALPEQMAHRTNKVQLQLVAVLALISLFTHNHLYWIAGLLLAMVELPDFSSPMTSIARSLAKIAGRDDAPSEPEPTPTELHPTPPEPQSVPLEAEPTPKDEPSERRG